jgi:predicted DNA-binding transcriptional regulator AlpA
MRRWLTFKEVAEELQIPLKSFYQYHYLGTGPKTHRFGKHLRVLESDLIAWEEESSLKH